jgi:hypothetical protein
MLPAYLERVLLVKTKLRGVASVAEALDSAWVPYVQHTIQLWMRLLAALPEWGPLMGLPIQSNNTQRLVRMVDEAIVLLLKMRSKSHRLGLDVVPTVSQALHIFDWQNKLAKTEHYLTKLAGNQSLDQLSSSRATAESGWQRAEAAVAAADMVAQHVDARRRDKPRVDSLEEAQLQVVLAASAVSEDSGGVHQSAAASVAAAPANPQDGNVQSGVDQVATEEQSLADKSAHTAPPETIAAASVQVDLPAETEEFLILVFKGSTDILRNTLLTSPALEKDRSAMTDAGLELQPPWALGAVVLLDPDEVDGAKASIMSQQPAPAHRRNQVITNGQKETIIKETLLKLPCRKRPKCSLTTVMPISLRPQTGLAPGPLKLDLLDRIIIKNTFVHDWDNGTEQGAKTQSTGDRLVGHLNPRLGRI